MLNKFDIYAKAGFGPDLIPILPHDAQMKSEEMESRRGKVPGWLTESGEWVGYGKWTGCTATERDLKKWAGWPGAGVGLQARNFPAVDIDVDDADMAARLEKFVKRELGPAPARVGRPPRVVLPYRLAEDQVMTKRRINLIGPNGDPHAIEFLGSGQQYVVEGIHPATLKPYTWSGNMLAGELSTVTVEQIDSCIEKIVAALAAVEGWSVGKVSSSSTTDREEVEQDHLAAPSPEHVIKLLEDMPNELEYDDWVRFSVAVKAAGGEEVYEAWETWCLKYPQNTQQNCVEKWESFYPPYAVGWDYVRGIARDAGQNDAVNAFDSLPVAPGDTPAASPANVTDEEVDQAQQIAKNQMFGRFCYVLDIKRFIDLETMQMLDKEQFNATNADVGPVYSSTKCAASIYLNATSQRRMYRRLTYRPGQNWLVNEDGVSAVNTWRPSTLVLPKGEVTDLKIGPWLDHMKYLIPDDRERAILLRWCAFMVQHPERKINWAILLGGGQGIGKDLAFQPLMKIMGAENIAQINAATIAGGYTDWAHGKKLVVVEEMHSFERKDTMNRLKPFIAAPPDELRINIKYTPQFQVPNILCMLLFTNLIDALGLEDDDRRFFVVWSDAKPESEGYYSRLVNWYENGGYEAVAGWLMKHDVSDFEASGRAPATSAKDDMRRASLPILNAWIEECLADGVGPFARPLIALEDILAAMPNYVSRTRPTKEKVSNILKRLGAVPLGQVRLSENHPFTGNSRLRLWAIREKTDMLGLWTNQQFVRLRAIYETGEVENTTDILG